MFRLNEYKFCLIFAKLQAIKREPLPNISNACLKHQKCLSVDLRTSRPFAGQINLGIIHILMKVHIMFADDIAKGLGIYGK